MQSVKRAVMTVTVGLGIMGLFGCGADMPTRDKLATDYPEVLTNSGVAENKKILCPFLRMIEKTGLIESRSEGGSAGISTPDLVRATTEFGCSVPFCGALANGAAVAQPGLEGVNLEALHTARAVAHECGLMFAFEGTEVDDGVRESTLNSLAELANEEGHLTYADLLEVKLGICESQGVQITLLGRSEVKLIFAYLGGLDRGYVTLSDVEKFFNAELPETIGSERITEAVILKVRS